jgi:beta-glucosidase-like glycosyl hydrolase
MPPSHLDQSSPPWSANNKKKSRSKRSPERHEKDAGLLKISNTPVATAASPAASPASKKKRRPADPSGPPKKKNRSPQITDKAERANAAKNIMAVNAASGGMNDKAASLAASIMRGVTMRPSGKWQAQLYFAGKSRYIGVFDSREKAALAYEIAREKLKAGPNDHGGDPKTTENFVNLARKAAFEGVNEKLK